MFNALTKSRMRTALATYVAARTALLCLVLLFALAACAPTTGIFSSSGDWQASGPPHQHIRALTVNPNDARKLYAGDEQGNVFISTDAAQHWTERSAGLPLPAMIHALSFDGAGKKLYAATEKGLFVSVDDGQQWSALNTTATGLPSGAYTALATSGSDTSSQAVYVGTATSGLFVSRNGGTIWTPVGHDLPQGTAINDVVFDTDKQQVWIATLSGVYRLGNQGAWQLLNTGLPEGIVVNTVRLASMSGGPQNLVYLGTNRGFFRSDDAGAHWTTSTESLSRLNIYRILVDFRASSGSVGNTVFIATSAGAFRTVDGGLHWQGIAAGLPVGTSVYDLTIGADGNTQLYAAADQVYQYPGNGGGGLSPMRIISIGLVLLFFYLLYRFITRRGRSRQRKFLTPEPASKETAPPHSNTTAPDN
ncbi:MAG TPA: hypothetical protein VKR06_10935 [Ktedonosporobacter sp.]|nr:hypothetical protein [Ktedonosporobacter sp.]